MPEVYVYFDELTGVFSEERELLEYCQKSWEAQGWTFIVLSRGDAYKHPAFKAVNSNEHLVYGAPTPLTQAWQRCSYNRWMALQVRNGGGLLIDYDMINYSFTPDDFENDFGDFDEINGRRYHGRDQFTFDAPAGLCPPTPCLIGRYTLTDIINLMATYQGEPAWDYRCRLLHKECTDQLLLHYHGTHVGPLFWSEDPWCHMYGSPNWLKAPVVHYTHWSIAQEYTKNRLALIDLERPI